MDEQGQIEASEELGRVLGRTLSDLKAAALKFVLLWGNTRIRTGRTFGSDTVDRLTEGEAGAIIARMVGDDNPTRWKVLIVDDDEAFHNSVNDVVRTLRDHGAEVGWSPESPLALYVGVDFTARRRRLVLVLLDDKFGPLGDADKQRIEVASLGELEGMLKRLADAKGINDVIA